MVLCGIRWDETRLDGLDKHLENRFETQTHSLRLEYKLDGTIWHTHNPYL